MLNSAVVYLRGADQMLAMFARDSVFVNQENAHQRNALLAQLHFLST